MRKGELSSAAVDRGWPHQVTMLAANCTGEQHSRITEFCAGLSLARRGHCYFEGTGYWNVYCFAEREHAEAFAAAFGGRMLDPKDRPRWPGRGVELLQPSLQRHRRIFHGI